jgi:hypothetical protein
MRNHAAGTRSSTSSSWACESITRSCRSHRRGEEWMSHDHWKDASVGES